MENDKVSGDKEIWISYKDDAGNVVNGFFPLIEQTENYVRIKSGSNILTIPYHRINKMKERAQE